jgi:(p)ppGpp synthase/HD superfamily hydrolase
MVEVSFEINGKKVRPDQVANELDKAMMNRTAEYVKNKVSSIRCPDHGQQPKIKVKGKNLENLSFEISGCCQTLIEKARKELA